MTRKLASISSICDVNPRLPASLRSEEGLSVSFVPMSAVQEAGSLDGVVTRQLRDVLKGYTYFEEGDVLVAKITPCMENGKVAQAVGLPQPIGFGSTELHVLRPGPDVDGRYLFHMVWNPHFRSAAAGSMTGSAGQRRVPVSFFARFRIPLPPLPEQQRIAATLDKADAVCRKRQQTLDLADQFLRSAFLDMFGDPVTNPKGWPVVRLGDLLADIEGGWSPKCETRPAGDDEWGVLKLGAVSWGTYNPQENKAMVPDAMPRPDLEVHSGDLLFVRKNTYELVGATAFVFETRPRLTLPDLVFRLVLTEKADPIYMAIALSQPAVRENLRRMASGSAGSMPNISKTRLRELALPLPPVSSQARIRDIALRSRRCREKGRDWSLAAEALCDSLVQRAFRGGLA